MILLVKKRIAAAYWSALGTKSDWSTYVFSFKGKVSRKNKYYDAI